MPILAELHKTPVGGSALPLAFLYGGLPLVAQAPAADPTPAILPLPLLLSPTAKLRLSGPLYATIPIYQRIYGVTRDSTGAVLAGCTVDLFRTSDNAFIGSATSDATGNYEFRTAGPASTYYAVAYLAGSPDVFGTTANTLVGA